MKYLAIFCLALSLTGCSTTKTNVRNEAEASQYDSTTTARIRLFAEGMIQGGYISGYSCEKFYNDPSNQEEPERIGWKKGDVRPGGLFRKDENSVIGMPASKSTAVINESQLYYDEHIVPANRPLIVAYRAGGTGSVYCTPFPVIFTPQPGQDYEIWYSSARNRFNQSGCVLTVHKLLTIGDAIIERPVQPLQCIGQRVGEYQTSDPFRAMEFLRQPESTLTP